MDIEPGPKFRILIIEDSPFSAKVLQDLLDRFPWYSEKETTIFPKAEEGLLYLEKIKNRELLPGLIILDLELPGENGLEFLKKIKKNPLWKDIPVIVNSSSDKQENIVAVYKEGGVIFLRKSKDEAAFEEVIQRLKIRGLLKAPSKEEKAALPMPPLAAFSPKKRILVVDDSALACAACSSMLLEAGFEVECSSNAIDAIKIAQCRVFDLILMDIIMPSVDGIEACRRMKADEKLRDVPVIIVTVAEESEHLEKAFKAGAVDYIMKPIRQFELLARLNSALTLKARELELALKNQELKAAVDEITLLQGLLPVCGWCKKIRDSKGAWKQMETYIEKHSTIKFTHGICEECAKKTREKMSA